MTRDSDALGLMGGEEFAVLLPDTNTASALRIAERLREQARMQLVTGSFGECRYSISAGIATWRAGETFDRLSMRADRALYSAKCAGRNRVLPDGCPSPEASRLNSSAERGAALLTETACCHGKPDQRLHAVICLGCAHE